MWMQTQMWQKSHRMNPTVPTTALDTECFWLYNKHIQTGAHSEDHNQSTKEA